MAFVGRGQDPKSQVRLVFQPVRRDIQSFVVKSVGGVADAIVR